MYAPTVRTCRTECLSRPAFPNDMIKLDKVHRKVQTYIYLLTCTHFGVQNICQSITPLNLRMNIHRRAKQGSETSIDQ